MRKLLADLRWDPAAGTHLDVVVAPGRPLLWVDCAAPPRATADCGCNRCDADHSEPADRLLAAGHRLPEPAIVDDQHRLRLTAGHLAAVEATSTEPLAVVGLFDLGLLAVTTVTDLALHGALADVRVPDA